MYYAGVGSYVKMFSRINTFSWNVIVRTIEQTYFFKWKLRLIVSNVNPHPHHVKGGALP